MPNYQNTDVTCFPGNKTFILRMCMMGFFIRSALDPSIFPPGMVNFHDPAVVLNDLLAFVKLSHTLVGLYIWEFATTLDYEWSIFWGRRPYRWTIWIYSLTRLATLTTVINIIVGLNTKAAPNKCQALLTSFSVCDNVALAAAELLIVLRIIAIWNKRKVVGAIAIGIWLTNIAFLIHTSSQLRSGNPAPDSCLPRNVGISKLSTISTLVTDIVLLLIMLVGLLRLRVQGAGMFSLGQLLWKQGIVWLLIATLAGALPTIFLLLNLNDVWSIMFQFPWMISISIAATRMYRSLTDFVSGVSDMYPHSTEAGPKGGSGTTLRFSQNAAAQPLKQLEVAVHSTKEWYPMAQMSYHGSYASTDGPVTSKPNGLASD
ncbi:hypothetical protein BC826DRAFT_76281 [Russula brevipes]|nr:hypothetical protein BC826DRAFT_76281 [Russula brevipes]